MAVYIVTRPHLKVFPRHRNPVSIVTKGSLITRDMDVLEALAVRRT
jgi:DNA repair photolyase